MSCEEQVPRCIDGPMAPSCFQQAPSSGRGTEGEEGGGVDSPFVLRGDQGTSRTIKRSEVEVGSWKLKLKLELKGPVKEGEGRFQRPRVWGRLCCHGAGG